MVIQAGKRKTENGKRPREFTFPVSRFPFSDTLASHIIPFHGPRRLGGGRLARAAGRRTFRDRRRLRREPAGSDAPLPGRRARRGALAGGGRAGRALEARRRGAARLRLAGRRGGRPRSGAGAPGRQGKVLSSPSSRAPPGGGASGAARAGALEQASVVLVRPRRAAAQLPISALRSDASCDPRAGS